MLSLRAGALLFIFGPLAAMLVEPFFESLFDLMGWQTEKLSQPVVIWISDNTYIFTGMIGLGLGVWLHWFAARLTRGKSQMISAEPLSADSINPLDHHFERMRINLEDFDEAPYYPKKNKRFVDCVIYSARPILLNGNINFENSTLVLCDVVIVVVGKPIRNAIGFDDPQFLNCRLNELTLYVSQEIAQQMASKLDLSSSAFLSETFESEV